MRAPTGAIGLSRLSARASDEPYCACGAVLTRTLQEVAGSGKTRQRAAALHAIGTVSGRHALGVRQTSAPSNGHCESVLRPSTSASKLLARSDGGRKGSSCYRLRGATGLPVLAERVFDAHAGSGEDRAKGGGLRVPDGTILKQAFMKRPSDSTREAQQDWQPAFR